MMLRQITRHPNLSGIGALRAGGRWHYAGQPVVYLAENPASALLEVCVHTAANNIPPEFTLLRIEGPGIEIRPIAEADLTEGWQTRFEITRSLGTDWLRRKEAALLRLPSAIVPETVNF